MIAVPAVAPVIEVDAVFAVAAMSCLKTPESSTLYIPAWFMLMGRFAGSGSSRRPESRDASACSTVIASAAVVVPGPPSPTVRFAPGHVTPMTQVSGTNELMTQIHDAWLRLDETGHATFSLSHARSLQLGSQHGSPREAAKIRTSL
jgi:hypothetical protein